MPRFQKTCKNIFGGFPSMTDPLITRLNKHFIFQFYIVWTFCTLWTELQTLISTNKCPVLFIVRYTDEYAATCFGADWVCNSYYFPVLYKPKPFHVRLLKIYAWEEERLSCHVTAYKFRSQWLEYSTSQVVLLNPFTQTLYLTLSLQNICLPCNIACKQHMVTTKVSHKYEKNRQELRCFAQWSDKYDFRNAPIQIHIYI